MPIPSLPDELLPYVPGVVRWVGIASIPASALVGDLVGRVLRALSRRALAPSTAHWTERARAGLGPRTAFRFVVLYVGIVAALFVYLDAYFFSHAVRTLVAFGAGLGASLAADRHRRRFLAELHDRPIASAAWYAFLARWLFLGAPMFTLLVWGAATMPRALDHSALVRLGLVALGLLTLHSGALWLLAGAIGLLPPASAELRAVVEDVASSTGVRPRGVLVFPTGGVPLANAFAIPAARRLVFTEELLSTLSRGELAAVTAHELGHVDEGRAAIALRVLKGLVFLPLVLVVPAHAAYGLGGPLVAVALFFVLARLFQGWSRGLEARADRVAHGAHGEDGVVYARALERIYQTNLVPAVVPQRGTHPQLWDRIQSAGVTPDYPRPEPANTRPARLRALVIAGAVVTLYAIGGTWAREKADERIDAALEKIEP